MTNAPLFALAHAENAILVTPQRDLSEFDFAQIETEVAEILGQISKDAGLNVVVDFSKIDYCGSTARGFFTTLFKKTRYRGGEMAFCNVSPGEREVLRVTRLDTLWPICDTLEDAMEAVATAARRTSDSTWIVVADRAIARIFEQRGGADKELKAVTTLRHGISRSRYSDEVSDSKGYFRRAGTVYEAGQPNQDHRHHTAEEFAREISGYLDMAQQRKEFSHLVLMAPPFFLGALRDSLPASLSELVEHEVRKDYTRLDGAEIRRHVGELAASV